MQLNAPPQAPIFYAHVQSSLPAVYNMPLLQSLIHASHNKYSFYEWIKLIPKCILEMARKPYAERSEQENLDITASAIFYMTLDQNSDLIKASDSEIIEVVDEIELALFVEILNRSRGINIILDDKYGLNRHSFYLWNKLASLAILKIITTAPVSVTEILYDAVENYMKPKNWYPKRDK